MDDYIKRQDAIDELMEMVKTHSGDQFGGVLLHYTGIKAMLECIEPANVRPVVRGKWEKDSDGVPHCTNCDSLAPQKLVLHIKTISCTAPFVQSKFCPNCGSYNGGYAE